MPLTLRIKAWFPTVLEFRRESADDILLVEELENTDLFSGIRCPLCKWRPLRTSLWTCWDVDHPEYFYDGCGTTWNTFETRGICPTCKHRWAWTSCHSCSEWSRHDEWYT